MVTMGLGLLRSHFKSDPDGRSRVSQQPPAGATWPRPYSPPLLPDNDQAWLGTNGQPFLPKANSSNGQSLFWETPLVWSSLLQSCILFEPLSTQCPSFILSFHRWHPASVRVASYSIPLYPLQVWLPITLLHVLFFHRVCFSWHLNWYNHQCYFALVFISL